VGKLNAGLFHWDNVILHGLNAIVLYLLLQRLSVPGAWLAAAIFGVHPVHVESVAWITERKNILSGLFYLLSLSAYLHFCLPESKSQIAGVSGAAEARCAPGSKAPATNYGWVWYALALILFCCALLSKTITCSLPAAVLLILWWKHGKIIWRDVAALVPFFALGLGLGLVTVWLEKHHVGAEGEEWDLSLPERFLIAGRALWFYVGKLVWPANLTFIYQRWKIDAGVWWQYAYPLTFLAVMMALWQARGRIGRGPLVAVLFFAGTLVPALGFFDVFPMRFSFVADHFQYLASIGIIALAAALFTLAFRSIDRGRNWMPAVAAAGILSALGAATWQRCHAYQDQPTIWHDTLKRNPESWLPHGALGQDVLSRALVGRTREERAELLRQAEDHFRNALAVAPGHAEMHCNLGVVLLNQAQIDDSRETPDLARKRRDEAIYHFSEALAKKPNHYQSQISVGMALCQQGRLEEAKEAFRKASRIEPRYGKAHLELATVHFQEGKLDDAKREIEKAIRLEPNLVTVHSNFGIILLQEGNLQDAKKEFMAEVKINPQNYRAHYYLGQIAERQGQLEEALECYRQAAALRADDAQIRAGLTRVLQQLGRSANRPDLKR
jgi:tetratricopeptide (TPR) repeat protein